MRVCWRICQRYLPNPSERAYIKIIEIRIRWNKSFFSDKTQINLWFRCSKPIILLSFWYCSFDVILASFLSFLSTLPLLPPLPWALLKFYLTMLKWSLWDLCWAALPLILWIFGLGLRGNLLKLCCRWDISSSLISNSRVLSGIWWGRSIANENNNCLEPECLSATLWKGLSETKLSSKSISLRSVPWINRHKSVSGLSSKCSSFLITILKK